MARLTAAKRAELESFWRAHLEGWRRSDLNQREYCAAHGLPLKRFGNWRAALRHEETAGEKKLLYRRGGGLSHMSNHMTKEPVPYIPSARSTPPGSAPDFQRGGQETDRRRDKPPRGVGLGGSATLRHRSPGPVPLEAGPDAERDRLRGSRAERRTGSRPGRAPCCRAGPSNRRAAGAWDRSRVDRRAPGPLRSRH